MDNNLSFTDDLVPISVLLDKIKNGRYLDDFSQVRLTVDDLLKTDELGVTYLSYACDNRFVFIPSLQEKIGNNKDAVYVLIKKCSLSMVSNVDENIFFEKDENGKLFLELVLEDDDSLMCYFLSNFEKRTEILDYLVKYNRLVFLFYFSDEFLNNLFIENNGSFIIDKYINDKDFVFYLPIGCVPLNTIFNYCIKKGNYELLKHVDEEGFLKIVQDGKTLLEFILDKNVDYVLKARIFNRKETFDILVKRGRFDLLHKSSLDLLFSEYDSGKTCFEFMVEKYKNGFEMNFEKMVFDNFWNKSGLIARALIFMAENNIIGFILPIKSYLLLFKGRSDDRTVFSWLMEMDKGVTLSTIIPNCIDKGNPDLVIALRSFGIDAKIHLFVGNDILDKRFCDEYLDRFNSEYTVGCVSRCEDKLIELRDLFYGDGISDRKLVDAFINSYRYLTSSDKYFGDVELQKLIDIKRDFPKKFVINRSSNSSFSIKYGDINLDSTTIIDINHETTHALHYYLTNEAEPEHFWELIEKIRNDPYTIDLVSLFSRLYYKMKKTIMDSISNSTISEYYNNQFTDEKLEKLSDFLTLSKKSKKKMLINDYPEDVLDIILDKSYSIEEFIEQRKEIEKLEFVDAVFRTEEDAFIAISDIIDAIFLGKYCNGVISNKLFGVKGEYGHGIQYYSSRENVFPEILANFGSIIKSKKSDEALSLLRGIVGDELVDMLLEFYYQDMLESTRISDKEEEFVYER